jgi:NAD(P)-dependent dehydrogenase (short-subunit alcohol dehydrogenase family)
MLMGLLTGQVALVTGAGGGIGRAIALAAAAEGAAVVANDYGVTVDGLQPSAGPGDSVAAEIVAAGGQAVAHSGSVAAFGTARELTELAVERFGRLDIAITAHGILRERMVFNMSEDEWTDVITVHLTGTFNVVRFASAHMRQHRSGSILLVSSAAGLEGSAGQANYAAAKMGIVGLTYATALAMGKYDVSVNALAPGADTRMTQRLDGRFFGDREPVSPATAAALAVALCAPAARGITGQVYTGAGRKIARWSHPAEEQIALGPADWDASAALDTVTRQFANPPLARFARQGLAEPAAGPEH